MSTAALLALQSEIAREKGRLEDLSAEKVTAERDVERVSGLIEMYTRRIADLEAGLKVLLGSFDEQVRHDFAAAG
jgi:predicted  nucleic acid-binding Zn-ribbon protein